MITINRTTSRQDLLRRVSRLQREAAYHAVKAQNCNNNQLAAAYVHHSVRFVELMDEAKSLRGQAKTVARTNRPARQPAHTSGWFSMDHYGVRLVVTNVDSRQVHGRVESTLLAFIEGDVDDGETGYLVRQLVTAMNRDATLADWLHAEDIDLKRWLAVKLPDGYAITLELEGEIPGRYDDEIPGQHEWASSRGVAAR